MTITIETPLNIRPDGISSVVFPSPNPPPPKNTEGWESKSELEGSCRACGLRQPHHPHVTSHYDTVRNGTLERFCLGRSGWLDNGNYLCLEVDYFVQGDCWSPSRAVISEKEIPLKLA